MLSLASNIFSLVSMFARLMLLDKNTKTVTRTPDHDNIKKRFLFSAGGGLTLLQCSTRQITRCN